MAPVSQSRLQESLEKRPLSVVFHPTFQSKIFLDPQRF
jgi:hypothetical protein